MSTEELIREIISKLCPLHGKHATVKVLEAGQVSITACCAEFHRQMEKIIDSGFKKSFELPVTALK